MTKTTVQLQTCKYQTTIEMQDYQRSTNYGFRHTFIDELKRNGVGESLPPALSQMMMDELATIEPSKDHHQALDKD